MLAAMLLAVLAGGAVDAGLKQPPVSVAPGAPLPAYPRRIVSLNPCADAILMRIAEPARIAAISHYSQDPAATSIPLAQARRFAVTAGTAEEVLAMQPDLVIAGPHVALPTIEALKRLHIPLMQLSVPESVAESEQQIATLSRELGVAARGAQLNMAIDAALAAARPVDKKRVPALIWQGGGMVPGGGTLADELLARTGYRNMSAAYGLKQWDILPLEYLLARPPRVLFSNIDEAGRSDRMLSHPAVRALGTRVVIGAYPSRLLHCAGPTIIDAAARLADQRRQLGGVR